MALSGPDRQYLGLRYTVRSPPVFNHGEFPFIFDQLRGFSWKPYSMAISGTDLLEVPIPYIRPIF